MANVKHSLLTGSDLHEPKGISSAGSGEVYIADGLGSGSWGEIETVGDRVVVADEADFPAAVGGVITLAADTEYQIVSDISTSNRFVFNNNTVISGLDEFVTTLTYTGTGTFFTVVDSDVRIKLLKINCASGTLISASNTAGNEGTSIVFFQNVISDNIKTLGTITSLQILGLVTVGFFNITTDGFTFTGTGSKNIVIQDTTFIQAVGTSLQLGTTTFDGISIGNVQAVLSASTKFLDGTTASGNINSGGGGNVSFCTFTGAGTPLTDITADDVRWNFFGNNTIADTRPDGLLSATGPTTVTITTVNTPVKVAGTWVVERASQFTGATNGRLTYNGAKNTVIPISVVVSAEPESGTNKAFTFYIAKNGTTIANSASSNKADATDPKSTTVLWQDSLSTNDYIELWVENNTDNINIKVNTAILRIN